MEDRISKYQPTVRRILKNEDSRLGFVVVWYLSLTVFPTAGFYLGTIVSPYSNAYGIRHFYDLHIDDMHVGGIFALIGLAIGLCFSLWITFWYPKLKEADAAADEEHERLVHSLLSHHDIISTDVGQDPEHLDEH
jgi:lysylphosphatidylglycerol synthetase-like protein (DUF2156 family)